MNEYPDLENNPVLQSLRRWDPNVVAGVHEFRGELTLQVPREHVRRAAEFLCAEPGLEFSFLSDITAVDRFPLEPRFELNYHIVSISRRQPLRMQVSVPGGSAPAADSVTSVWPTANWHEREIFDLFGIRFHGHPDLRRILMPDNWEGHPQRKDYPVEGFR